MLSFWIFQKARCSAKSYCSFLMNTRKPILSLSLSLTLFFFFNFIFELSFCVIFPTERWKIAKVKKMHKCWQFHPSKSGMFSEFETEQESKTYRIWFSVSFDRRKPIKKNWTFAFSFVFLYFVYLLWTLMTYLFVWNLHNFFRLVYPDIECIQDSLVKYWYCLGFTYWYKDISLTTSFWFFFWFLLISTLLSLLSSICAWGLLAGLAHHFSIK